ncbi:MAG TPA: S9 family peptidase [Bryobacteraceae bacterium]|nr:S9 family peptidase [Bryobacteraceae bacterium]
MKARSITLLMSATLFAADPALKPPVAPRQPHEVTRHGDKRIDPYFWLRDRKNPEVIAYLEAENKYTEAVMKPTEALQKKLYGEILGRIKETDLSVPARQGKYLYYSRTEQGKQYSIFCRKPIGSEREEILLDENALAAGHKYLRVQARRPSTDHRLLAYSVDYEGDEKYTIVVKDLTTGELLSDRVNNSDGTVQWANDNKTLFYVTLDDTKRPDKVWRHLLGSSDADKLAFHEPDSKFEVSLHKTRSRQYLLIASESRITSDIRYLRADQPAGEFQQFVPRVTNVEYEVEDQNGWFFIRTNEGAKNFKLMKTHVANTARKNWVEVIPARAGVKIEGIDAFHDYLVVYERDKGLPTIRIEGKHPHSISFPEPAYTVSPESNYEYDTHKLRFRYSSLVTPGSVYDYDMETKTRELRKQEEVVGGYDPAKYISERIFAPAKDGTRIPIALVYKKGIARDGKTPLLLYAYGSYGINTEPSFSSTRLSLMDRGFIYAIANIRGGAEMGEEWREQGRMLTKLNTFHDFIASAEHLIAQKYTSSDRLAAMGGSAGGLLMGAVVNLRPDLFHSVIAKVPFVDVLNTMLDATLPLTTNEYEEWGNPEEKKYYDYIKSYSPYDNVAKAPYPNMLVTGGLNDPRVSYWEPAKWVAKLRASKTDKHLLLLKIEMGSGHFGSSGRYERIKETAFDYAFLLSTFGIME